MCANSVCLEINKCVWAARLQVSIIQWVDPSRQQQRAQGGWERDASFPYTAVQTRIIRLMTRRSVWGYWKSNNSGLWRWMIRSGDQYLKRYMTLSYSDDQIFLSSRAGGLNTLTHSHTSTHQNQYTALINWYNSFIYLHLLFYCFPSIYDSWYLKYLFFTFSFLLFMFLCFASNTEAWMWNPILQ